ncbi:hypothetical protein Godav_023894 [Gossypium davidsonii]|uniref:Uncharacterized protein n=1 Tax=Gossypium davidsonii TaxID=34287 RepID=A0A7J8ST77_GOSDV|nr:hypothetical protein [Gossypium davidsonii]
MPWFRIHGKSYLLLAVACPKRTTWPFKSKKKGRRRSPINSTQTITWPIISAHTITKPSNSTDTVTQLSIATDNTHGTAFSDDARCVS